MFDFFIIVILVLMVTCAVLGFRHVSTLSNIEKNIQSLVDKIKLKL